MSAHTPGPWTIDPNKSRSSPIHVLRDGYGKDRHVASVYGPDVLLSEQDLVAQANARLIAAAPQLLEALRAYVQNDDIGARLSSATYQRAIAAIATATGAA